jgi:hypothetical protein
MVIIHVNETDIYIGLNPLNILNKIYCILNLTKNILPHLIKSITKKFD